MILERIIPTAQLRKICASFLALVILAIQLPVTEAAANSLATGIDVLGNSTKAETSAHSVRFTTQTNLDSGDQIKLWFPDFTLNLDDAENVSVTTGPTTATTTYSNSAKTITFTLAESFAAGSVVIAVADGKITNPATEGEYSVSILTLDASENNDVLDSGIAKAGVENEISITINVIPVITNVTSSRDDSTYEAIEGEIIPVQITFTGKVYVTGTPELTLSAGGVATYSSGSGSSTLTFNYNLGDKNTGGTELHYLASDSLDLADGTIGLANGKPAILTLPEPGEENSFGYNKNIFIQYRNATVANPPNFYDFEIIDEAGKTSDSTPLLKFEADNEATNIALSCDGGTNWSDWISYPVGNQLNLENEDFDILSCGSSEGLKTISAKLSNSSGYESAILQNSTIFEQATTESNSGTSDQDNQGEDEGQVSTTSIQTIDVIEPIDTSKVTEVGYVDPNEIWKSFRDVAVDENGQVTVETNIENKIEVREIEIENLTNYQPVTTTGSGSGSATTEEETTTTIAEKTAFKIFTKKPILPTEGGKIPVSVKLLLSTTDLITEDTITLEDAAAVEVIEKQTAVIANVEISAGTQVVNGGGGGSGGNGGNYTGAIYSPRTVMTPPASSDTNVELQEAFFVGSSSGSIKFDQAVKLTLPVDNKKNPQIYYFDEATGYWISAIDIKDGSSGGELSEDGKMISVWVKHFTLFAVVEVKDLQLLGIKRIAVGSDTENRANFTSGEWFSPADVGNDDLVSFAWSGTGEKFYYIVDENSFPTSLANKISGTTTFTTKFYLDNVKIEEGESYFHVVAEGADETRSKENIFVVNYDKTPPRLEKVWAEDGKLKLVFSEAITTFDSLTLYLNSGEMVEIPAIKSATTSVEAAFELAENAEIEVVSVVGMLVDRAGLIAINPEPFESASNKIRNAKLTILHPTQLIEGKYFTKKNSVGIIPYAEGATKMRLAANILDAENEWIDFAEKEIQVPLKKFGAQKILLEFSSETGESKSTGVVVTRLPANSAELEAMQAKQTSALAILREKIAAKLKSLITWGIKSEHEEILAESNPAIFPAEAIPSQAKIVELNAALAIAQKVRTEMAENRPSVQKITKYGEQLFEQNFTLDDFLTLAEINSLLGKITNEESSALKKYFDASVITFSQNGEVIHAGQISLGMRDSDSDGISDLLEIEIGSNPFLQDSDGDGNSDGAEFLQFGSDPLTADLPISAGFVNLDKKIENPKPLFQGIAAAGENLRVVAVNANGEEILLGETTADTEGKWMLISEVVLQADTYELSLKNDSQSLATQTIEINLDFILLPPKIFAGKSEVFYENQPAFFGNTFYGSRIIAFFDQSAVAIVTDNSLGDFVIKPPYSLKVGNHTLTLFTELADGSKSPTRSINFVIEEAPKSTAPISFWKDWSSRQNQLILAALGILTIAGFFLLRKKRS